MHQEVLPLMVDLSLRVKNGNVRSIVFKHGEDGFLSPRPDFPRMRERVKVAIGEAKAAKPAKAKSPSGKGTSGKSTSGKGTESEDVADTCAYNPEMAATATPYRG
jgi:hypothetical protein